MAKKNLDGYNFYAKQCWGYSDLWHAIVETPRGRVYNCSWRKDEAPTEDEIKEAWLTERHIFTPGY